MRERNDIKISTHGCSPWDPKETIGSEDLTSVICTSQSPSPRSSTAIVASRVLGGNITSISCGANEQSSMTRARPVVRRMVNIVRSPSPPSISASASSLLTAVENCSHVTVLPGT